MSKPTKGELERTIILCVDRDDDLGVKAGIKTPVLGREENVSAATTLILKDPEEADANAIFEAVRLYDHLNEEVGTSRKYQIATITGSELGGVGADRKLVSELAEVLEGFPASDVILVTDGYADGTILPLVESRVPVTSVRRVVIKHSKSIEETVAVFSRYLKMLSETPYYSRILIGLPGILLIVLGILFAFNLLFYTWIVFLIVLGTFLFVKGFGVDRLARSFFRWVQEFSPPPFPVQITSFSAITGVLLIAIGVYQGAFVVNSYFILNPPPSDLGEWITILPMLAGKFVSGGIPLIVIGVCVLLSGRAIRWFFERDSRLWRTLVIVVACACLYPIFYEASLVLINPSLEYTNLVTTIIIGIAMTVVAFLVTSLLRRKFAPLFKEKDVEIEKG